MLHRKIRNNYKRTNENHLSNPYITKTESCNVSFNSKGLNASSHETSAFIFACSGRLNNKLINIPNKEIHIMFLLLDRTEVAFPLYIIRLKNSTPINSEKLVYKIPRSMIISICGTYPISSTCTSSVSASANQYGME